MTVPVGLFLKYGRGNMHVINPDGTPEDQEMVTAVFLGLHQAVFRSLRASGKEMEAHSYQVEIPTTVDVDIEALLGLGYQVLGVPEEIWNLVLIH